MIPTNKHRRPYDKPNLQIMIITQISNYTFFTKENWIFHVFVKKTRFFMFFSTSKHSYAQLVLSECV